MIKGFREFISKGNVIDLAVAVVIGAAFAALIKSIVDGLINPLIAAIFGKLDLAQVGAFTINNPELSLGIILSAIINFVAVAAVIYFLVIVPYNAMRARMSEGEVDEIDGRSPETKVLEEIRDLLAQGRGTA